MNIEYFNRIVATYKIGADEFLDLFSAQGHKCAVCRRDLVLFSSHTSEQPQVDHNHATQAVRGILCRTCNVSVGFIEKDAKRTSQCLDYLSGYVRSHRPKVSAAPEESKDWSGAQWKAWRQSGSTPEQRLDNWQKQQLLRKVATGKLGGPINL